MGGDASTSLRLVQRGAGELRGFSGLDGDGGGVVTDDPWHIPTMQRAHEERLRETRRWLIAEINGGFEVHEWTHDGVAPWSFYPVPEAAAARLLQLMGIKHAIVPQSYPEEVCIGHIERGDE